MRNAGRNWLICGLLVAVTLLLYLQAVGFSFVSYDDYQYVVDNPHVKHGLNASSIAWAFTDRQDANWIPLVWMSYMVDHLAGGQDRSHAEENASPFHRTNAALHTINTLLLFALLNLVSGKRWRSAFVAGLFALHPMHVESVAWVSERKDVLSTFFLLLTLIAYAWYARRPSAGRYMAVLVAFACGLMSKSMLVTVPFLLLLMDFWPLKRWSPAGEPGAKSASLRKLIVEKLPMLAMAAAVGVVTIIQQQHAGALTTLNVYPLGVRSANAIVCYVAYVLKMVWPSRLAVFYPHPGTTIPAWQVAACAGAMVAVTAAALAAAKRAPYVTIGWLWYVITLVPVIGLVQVGDQAMADRYTYVPYIGLFVAIAWGVADIAARRASARRAIGVGAVVITIALGAVAYRQVGYWQDSRTLFGHAVGVTKDNAFAHFCLAMSLDRDGETSAAASEYRTVLRLQPDDWIAANNLADILINSPDQSVRNPVEAVRLAELACRVTSCRRPEMLSTLAVAYWAANRCDESRRAAERAVKLAESSGRPELANQIRADLAAHGVGE